MITRRGFFQATVGGVVVASVPLSATPVSMDAEIGRRMKAACAKRAGLDFYSYRERHAESSETTVCSFMTVRDAHGNERYYGMATDVTDERVLADVEAAHRASMSDVVSRRRFRRELCQPAHPVALDDLCR